MQNAHLTEKLYSNAAYFADRGTTISDMRSYLFIKSV